MVETRFNLDRCRRRVSVRGCRVISQFSRETEPVLGRRSRVDAPRLRRPFAWSDSVLTVTAQQAHGSDKLTISSSSVPPEIMRALSVAILNLLVATIAAQVVPGMAGFLSSARCTQGLTALAGSDHRNPSVASGRRHHIEYSALAVASLQPIAREMQSISNMPPEYQRFLLVMRAVSTSTPLHYHSTSAALGGTAAAHFFHCLWRL